MQEEIKKQYTTELRFFNPKKINQIKKDQVKKLANHLVHSRIKQNPKQYSMSDVPARRIIKAERMALEKSLKKTNVLRSSNTNGYYKGEYWKGTKESFVLNAIPITVNYANTNRNNKRKDLHQNHLGDCLVDDIGSYKDIVVLINKVTNEETQKEIILAEYMLDFCKNGKTMSLIELQDICVESTEKDLHNLTKIFYFCFIKEITRRMLPKDSTHRLPWALAQARALKLIIRGELTMKQVFDQNSDYGVATGTNIGQNIDALKDKFNKINKKYEQCFSNEPINYKEELLSVFGAKSDSDTDYEEELTFECCNKEYNKPTLNTSNN